jgi:ABC-type multidrug transport system fused ATPase/permease subunit
VVDKDEIVEQGDPEDLLALGGIYASVWRVN